VCSVKLLASTYRNAFRINVQTITFRRNFNEKRLACAERYDLIKRDGQIYVELRCRLCLCSVSFVFEYKQRIYYIKNFISEFSIIYFYVMYVQKRPRIVPFHETTSMCDVILRPNPDIQRMHPGKSVVTTRNIYTDFQYLQDNRTQSWKVIRHRCTSGASVDSAYRIQNL